MDPYDAVRVLGWCLQQATAVLEDVAGDKKKLDLHGEFIANWRADVQFPMLLWTASDAGKRGLHVVNVDFPYKKGLCAITDDVKRTTAAFKAADANPGTAFEESAQELVTERYPAFDPDRWPPKTLKDVLSWLEGWAPELRSSLLGRLESLWTKDRTHLVVLFTTPSGRFGFSFPVAYPDAATNRRLAKHHSDRRQRILMMNPTIERFAVNELSPSFVHGRNQVTRETLAGRRIALIGCGAVGGYLATFLARLGAGFGAGSLKLYEQQTLQPENLGRHVLSMRDLYRNKADGIAELLRQEFPWLTVVPRKVDAIEATDLFEAELVVDATGSSAVSAALNARHIERLRADEESAAMLYTWVEGRGDAARTLLVDSLKYMCYECQFLRQPDRQMRDRFPVTTRADEEGREFPGDCSSYMPFAVSAATTAAALALDAARDWARGDPHPRLRSRRLDRKNTQARGDASPKPLDGCPACRPR